MKQRFIRNAAVIAYTLAVTSMAGEWAIRYAFMERGYHAIGGEYLFIPAVSWVAYKAINTFFEALEENKDEDGRHKKRRSRGAARMRYHK